MAEATTGRRLINGRSGILIVLTGKYGAGKTTVCQTVIAEARARGLAVRGVITERVLDSGGRTRAREVVDLFAGARAQLNEYVGPGGGDESTPNWRFFPEGVDLANAVLASVGGASRTGRTADALVDGDETPEAEATGTGAAAEPDAAAEAGIAAGSAVGTGSPDLLVVDEIGPLELLSGKGFTEALPLLRDGEYGVALVVVRDWLVGYFVRLVARRNPCIVFVAPGSAAIVAREISAILY